MRRSCGTSFVRASWLASLAVAALATGCVPYQTYKAVVDELDRAKDRNEDLIKEYNRAVVRLKSKEGENPSEEGRALLAQLERENSELKRQIATRPASIPFRQEDLPAGAEDEEGGMRLGEALLFPEGMDKLKPEAFRTLDQITSTLRTRYPDEMVIIEGHTDDQPLSRTLTLHETNINLGYKRAYAVFKYFKDHGIPEKRMILQSNSFNKPLNPATMSTTEGRRENRRVVVRRGGTRI
ncbi:MAG TPA: OmpA family protein [Planctomycetota bacterium]|nr:OmpA family protein [Planctomycetota bacterium]